MTLTGLEESCYRNQTCQSGRKYSVEYDSVLDQQSISGKNVSLILCVWKPGYMKSGHICRNQFHTYVVEIGMKQMSIICTQAASNIKLSLCTSTGMERACIIHAHFVLKTIPGNQMLVWL